MEQTLLLSSGKALYSCSETAEIKAKRGNQGEEGGKRKKKKKKKYSAGRKFR